MTVWGNYLALHARKQLAFGTRLSRDKSYALVIHCRSDMWWLGLAVFLVCIIEVGIGLFLS